MRKSPCKLLVTADSPGAASLARHGRRHLTPGKRRAHRKKKGPGPLPQNPRGDLVQTTPKKTRDARSVGQFPKSRRLRAGPIIASPMPFEYATDRVLRGPNLFPPSLAYAAPRFDKKHPARRGWHRATGRVHIFRNAWHAVRGLLQNFEPSSTAPVRSA